MGSGLIEMLPKNNSFTNPNDPEIASLQMGRTTSHHITILTNTYDGQYMIQVNF